MIVYFTGTGNSRYTAEMLAELLQDTAVSANDFIREGKRAQLESEKPWVFVCPVYVASIPRAFERFIRLGYFSGSRKVWFIVTCAGSSAGAAPAFCERLARECGFEYMGTSFVTMPQNYLVYFQTKEQAECERILSEAGPRINALSKFISAGASFPDTQRKKGELASVELILDPYYRHFMGTEKFSAGDRCISCGTCVRSCPLGNIHLENGKPVWGKDCTHCMACISLCPTEAVEYGNATVGKPRYHCPPYK